MKKVSIGNRILETPIIQGGMGIGVSLCRLAGAVAKEGGMGVISAAQVGYEQEEFQKSPEKANLKELWNQIKKAKEIAKGKGMVAVNIMCATRGYEEFVKQTCEAGADAIISGAGLPTDLPAYVEGSDTKIAPIVSSEKSASVILRHWKRRHNRTADFLVIEGPKAGGHLGFKPEQLDNLDAYDFDEEIKKIIEVKKQYEEEFKTEIPVFVGGGIFDKEDVKHVLELGADGVQVGTRFVATKECDASDAYKQAYVDATEEDVAIIKSPVGMPGRALNNVFIKKVQSGKSEIKRCYRCLKVCDPKNTPYCISQALMNAVRGNLDEGLIFCGARVGEIKEIITVKELMEELSV